MYRRFYPVFSLLLTCVLALSACGGEKTPAVSGPVEPAVSAFAPADKSDTPELPPEPALPYTNPLTGEGCQMDISANRPVAIMLNNLKKALPQHGVGDADIIFEVPAEGGITRMMAVFQALDGVGDIGSVRSARPYYVELAAGLDAIYIHAGGSTTAGGAYDTIRKLGVFNIDAVNGPYGGTMFWRDSYRRQHVGYEHSLFTSEARIESLLAGKLSGKRQTHEAGYSLPLTFAADGTPLTGLPADAVSIKFSNNKTGQFTFHSESGKYLVSQHGAPYVDGNTSQQVAVTNVIVVKTDISPIKGDSEGRLSVRTTGSGEGYFACGGKYIPIRWEKASAHDPLVFKHTDGTALALGVGTSYINIVGSDSPVTFAASEPKQPTPST